MSEKSLNDITRDVRVLYTRGSDAMLRDNFDYAIDLFTQVLTREPGVYECRRALRIAQAKKVGKGGSFIKKMWSSASASPLIAKGEIALHTNPAEALLLAEQILGSDPNSAAGHRLAVKAATALELPRTAVMSLEMLHHNAPGDKEVTIQLATTLADIGEVSRAEEVMGETCALLPNDPELQQAYKNISARKTLDEGGYEALADGNGSYRDILKNKEEAVSLEQEKRVEKSLSVTEKLIKEYEGRLKTEPGNLKLLRQLAECHTQQKQFGRALEYYSRLKASDMGNDPSLDEAITETNVKQFDYQIEQLDATAADYADKAAQLQAQKLAFQLEDCQKRVERFPTDLEVRYKLGQLCFQAGQISQAIGEFQKAQANPHRRIGSMNYLAQCYTRRKMYDLASRALQNALKEKPVFDEEKKDLTYNLGSVLELMGKKEEAIEQFKLIYELDIAYKDVAAKVDAYYASQG